jgi:hypothetical protein
LIQLQHTLRDPLIAPSDRACMLRGDSISKQLSNPLALFSYLSAQILISFLFLHSFTPLHTPLYGLRIYTTMLHHRNRDDASEMQAPPGTTRYRFFKQESRFGKPASFLHKQRTISFRRKKTEIQQ